MRTNTQGPWIVCVADGGYLITGGDGRTVCALPTICHSHREQAANAKLIAMAPDLLASLAEIVHSRRRADTGSLDAGFAAFAAAFEEAQALLDLLAEAGVTVGDPS